MTENPGTAIIPPMKDNGVLIQETWISAPFLYVQQAQVFQTKHLENGTKGFMIIAKAGFRQAKCEKEHETIWRTIPGKTFCAWQRRRM